MTLENYIDSIQKKRIAVIGYGVSNRPLVDLLLSKGCQVTICDQRSREKLGVAAEELESFYCNIPKGEFLMAYIIFMKYIIRSKILTRTAEGIQ